MARLARVVMEGTPHHVTQRGNRRQAVFFSDDDYQTYKGFLAEGCVAAGVSIWAYCLMPDHRPTDPRLTRLRNGAIMP